MEKVFDSTAYLTQRFSDLTGKVSKGTVVDERRKSAFKDFTNWGFPTLKHEEWKYTNVTSILKDGFELPASIQSSRQYKDLIVPGTEEDNHLFFVNGIFDTLSSKIVSPSSQWIIKPFYEAELGKEKENFQAYFGISSGYSNDGIGALSTAFANDGVYIEVNSNQIVDKPVHLHFISDGSSHGVLAMPRNLVVVNKNSQIQVVEYFTSIGQENPSLTNLVTEIVVHEDAILEYYKIQLEGSHANHVGTTHIHQVGKSVAHAVTVSLRGGVVRNNLNMVLDAEHAEANMHGLYLLQGETQVDNHTIADHRKPNCLSNELYKGILDDYSSGVFNGKIFVQPDAQKTNAYQSNKNILLSNHASINTKPQLEIFADDVKCSHGCTTGQLDEDALFYLRSRGISNRTAKAMLTKAYVQDILNTVKIQALKTYLEGLIEQRFEQAVD